ncbi:MAG: hypothetical protein HOE90_14070 [Bacteriovoracaceae bacterium]|jgi:hypothetical protein|nr:hypothetical protein [Bacteriovoracaceae bacterium]
MKLIFSYILLLSLSTSVYAGEHARHDNSTFWSDLQTAVMTWDFDLMDIYKNNSSKSITDTIYSIKNIADRHTWALKRLSDIFSKLDEIDTKITQLKQKYDRERSLGIERTGYNAKEEGVILSLWKLYIDQDHQLSILYNVFHPKNYHLVPTQDFASDDERDKILNEAMYISGSAGLTMFTNAYRLITFFATRDYTWEKLNSENKSFNIPAGEFDKALNLITGERKLEELVSGLSWYQDNIDQFPFERSFYGSHDFYQINRRVNKYAQGIQKLYYLTSDGEVKTNDQVAKIFQEITKKRKIQKMIGNPIYKIKKTLSLLGGNTQIVKSPTFGEISVDQLAPDLEMGDIILTRSTGYISNIALPGFWTHGALYLGSAKDLIYENIIDVKSIHKMFKNTEEGSVFRSLSSPLILEAVGEGVSFTSFETLLSHSNYILVIRVKGVSSENKMNAIKKAFGYLGTPYDFNFNFETSNLIVCTELIYQAYGGHIKWKMSTVPGSPKVKTLTATDMATHLFKTDPQLEIVLMSQSTKSGDVKYISKTLYNKESQQAQSIYKTIFEPDLEL